MKKETARNPAPLTESDWAQVEFSADKLDAVQLEVELNLIQLEQHTTSMNQIMSF